MVIPSCETEYTGIPQRPSFNYMLRNTVVFFFCFLPPFCADCIISTRVNVFLTGESNISILFTSSPACAPRMPPCSLPLTRPYLCFQGHRQALMAKSSTHFATLVHLDPSAAFAESSPASYSIMCVQGTYNIQS